MNENKRVDGDHQNFSSNFNGCFNGSETANTLIICGYIKTPFNRLNDD